MRGTIHPLPQYAFMGGAQLKHRDNSVFGLEEVDRWNPIRTFAIQSRSRPMQFLGFSNRENGALRQEISKWSMVCSTFSRRGWSVVRSALLVKGGTSKKRPSPHLHKVPTRSNKVSSRTLQTALVHCGFRTELHLLCNEEIKILFQHNLSHQWYSFFYKDLNIYDLYIHGFY
jgi:hypothetical protein